MNTSSVVRALLGEPVPDLLTALTWVPEPVLRSAVPNAPDEPHALVEVARRLRADLVFVDAGHAWASEAVVLLNEIGVSAGWTVAGPLTRATERLGWSETLRLSAQDPRRLTVVLEQLLQDALTVVRLGRARHADVLMVADDLAGVSGWLVSPDFAMDALVPCYRQLVSEWRSEIGAAVFHSDGDVRALMPKLFDAGFQGIHLGSQGEVLNAGFWSARQAGLLPLGGLEASTLNDDCTRVAEDAIALLQTGRAIIADDGGITTSHDLECLAATFTLMRERLQHDI